ncbi:ankyrin, partial [Choiromyces venosus 120613-1]
GLTPLSFAALYGNEGVVKLLLDREGVNPDSSDEHGRTLLSFAAEGGRKGVVKLLLDREGVNPNSSDEDGRTPLPYAARNGNQGVANLLLQRGAINPDESPNNSDTPLFFSEPNLHEGAIDSASHPEHHNPYPSTTPQHRRPTPDIPITLPTESETDSLPQQEDISASIREIPEDIPLPQSDVPPSNPPEPPRSASMLTNVVSPDAVPPGTFSRCLRATRRFFRRLMHKHFQSS